MPARSQLQQRKALEAARERALAARLAAHRPAEVPAPDAGDLAAELARAHPLYVFRAPESFTRKVRTHDASRIRLMAADHVFGRYPVAPHLRAVWREAPAPAGRQHVAELAEQRLRKQVYLQAASGGSVWRMATHGFLTKKETHRFLGVTHTESFGAALWFTLASSQTAEEGVAHRISVSRLADQSHTDPFWREVLRFFCVNPTPLAQMNDAIDFLAAEHAANPGYSVRGRTRASLAAQVDQWHRALARARRMGDAVWLGADIPDADYPAEDRAKGGKADWRFTQIKASRELAEEGTQMHHCVISYQAMCVEGVSSIWSLKTRPHDRHDRGPWTRALTVELRNRERRLVQIRGYANRGMNNDERRIVTKWASANGLAIAGSV